MRPHSYNVFITLLATLSCVSTFWAQSVYWSPSNGTLQEGKANSIDLFYDSCEPDGDPDLPAIGNLSLNFRGRSNSRSLINGRLSAKTIFNYQAIPSQLGQLTIPSFRVKTSEGEIQVPAARFEVVEATVGNSGLSPSEVFLSLFQIRDEKIYQGEVFNLDYIAGAKQEYQLADLSVPSWSPTRLVTNGLVDNQVTGVSYQGANYTVKVYQAKVLATESGTIEIPGAKQEATVVIGRRRDFMFQEPVYDAFTIESDPFALEVLPLPSGAPDSFNGAVGEFSLESQVVPEQVQVGEPVTWTLELSGTGNWPAGIGVPARSVSSRFKAIQPEIKNEFAENDLFTGVQTEDIVLIPTQEGSFEFGPIKYTYFDPVEERYKTIEIPSKTVTVVPPEPGNPALTSGSDSPSIDQIASGNSPYEQGSYDLDPTGQNTFEKPPEILKAPRLTSNSFAAPENPRSPANLIAPTAVALACPLAFWFLLALVKSASTDPRKQERIALAELRKISRKSPPNDPDALKQYHRDWRSAAAHYFVPGNLEPTPEEITNAAAALRDEEFANTWHQAWILSDKTLFGPDSIDQAEWTQLQKKAVDATPSKKISLSRVFKYESWFPAAIAVLILVSLTPSSNAQEHAELDPQQLYNEGNFAAAAANWITAINDAPYAAEPRYNAGLAVAQLGDWSTAWALWTSAFCLDPSNKDVAWNLRIAHQNTSAFDPVLQSLIEGEDYYSIIRLRSPAQWQTLSAQALWALGTLLTLGVVAIYFRPIKKLAGTLMALGALAGVLAYFAAWSHQKYEALGEPDTLLVTQESPLLSIPTDLQQEQVSTTVGAGTVVKLEKTFLSWMKINLPNGESGWLRQEKIMPLYGEISQL
ncbi:BatD family protein [Pelagicoccus mobilis]|uniref:BatD family protein n=1 Tax=Pelagicoccus mobilis TaxID=415221 RepID=A0A934RZH0_9BACT|nr:BatD family protein [Pelagicoccus mobilis]MBK1877726.1 BatD family protein [Pelagicoccus mobilis]